MAADNMCESRSVRECDNPEPEGIRGLLQKSYTMTKGVPVVGPMVGLGEIMAKPYIKRLNKSLTGDNMPARTPYLREAGDTSIRGFLLEKDSNVRDFVDGVYDGTHEYYIFRPIMTMVQKGFSLYAHTPVIGRFVQLAGKTADVGVKQLTKYEDCAELNENVSGYMPFIDRHFLSPQINACIGVAFSLCGPPVEAISDAAVPYMVTVEPYADRAVATVRPAFNVAYSCTRMWLTVNGAIVGTVWTASRPVLMLLSQPLVYPVQQIDEHVGAVLDTVSAADVFEKVGYAGVGFAKFLMKMTPELGEVLGRLFGVHEK